MKKEDKNKQSELTDKNKGKSSDISNSLEKGTTDQPLTGKQTPQGRTDNEQDRERQQQNKRR